MANPSLGEIECDCGCTSGVAQIRQKQTGHKHYYTVCENGMDQRAGTARQAYLKSQLGAKVTPIVERNSASESAPIVSVINDDEWHPEPKANSASETADEPSESKPKWGLWAGLAGIASFGLLLLSRGRAAA